MQNSSPRRGFLIFLALALAGTAGLMIFLLQIRSRQVNLAAHKFFFNQKAQTTAEAGMAILLAGVRHALNHPQDLAKLDQLFDSGKLGESGFYEALIQPLQDIRKGKIYSSFPPVPTKSHQEHARDGYAHLNLLDATLRKWLPSSHLNTLKTLEEETGAAITLTALINCRSLYGEPDTTSTSTFSDPIPKLCDLYLESQADFRGSQRRTNSFRRLSVYPLLPPVAGRFTFWHDGVAYYNNLVTDRFGRPAQTADGQFVYDLNFPLVMQHASGLTDVPATDASFYSAGGFGLDGLAGEAGKTANQALLGRRGFLYLGNSPNSILKLTPGLENAGQYFHLYSPAFFDAMEEKNGSADNPVIIAEQARPEILNDPLPTTWIYPPDPPLPPRSGELKGEAYMLYEGFFEDPTGALSPQAQIRDYTPSSSLLRVYGTPEFPSRAYTAGEATQEIARLSWIGLDMDQSQEDESRQENCHGRKVSIHDAPPIWLLDSSLGEFEAKSPYMFRPFPAEWFNRFFLPNCLEEPRMFTNPAELDWDTLFETYESYDSLQSKILQIPLNQMLDFPLYSHSIVPPEGHPDFAGFSFPYSDVEIWPFTRTELRHPEDFYVNGPLAELDPEKLSARRNWVRITAKELMDRGMLELNSTGYFLNTNGLHLEILDDLILDRPVTVTGHTSLYVNGQCILDSGQESEFLASFNCDSITLMQSQGSAGGYYPYYLYARGSIRKQNPTIPATIMGNLATARLADNLFQSPTTLIYDERHDPAGAGITHAYSMILEEGP